jgi:phenylpropionate dioxygenase-like ring-hydroxylating dioxygenase large terminal subunit
MMEEVLIERRIYTDPEIFHQEQCRIFRHTWQYVAHESELKEAGEYKVVMIAGESYLVCRDQDGTIRVLQNACRHRGATLVRGTRGRCSVLRCPYHAWTYDLQGRLIGVPLPEGYGDAFSREDFGLPTVRVEVFGGLIFACMDEKAPDLRTYLGEAAPYVERSVRGLEVIGYNKALFRGNWKFYQENFGDGYHPPFLHRAMGPAYLSSYHVNGEAVDLGGGHMLLIYYPPRPEHLDLSKLSAALGIPLSLETMWTSGVFNPYPADYDSVLSLFPNTIIPNIVAVTSIHRLIPLGPDRTLLEITILGDPNDSEEYRAFRLRQSTIWGPGGRAGIDDIAVAEKCQIGASVAGAPPFLMARGAVREERGIIVNEYTLRGFYREWRRYMGWSQEEGGHVR